jgi:hypothetical protein
MYSSTDKLYDLTTIYAISDNNPQFLEKLLLIFADNVNSDLQLLKQAANAGDWHEVGQLAHKMKPSLNHFGVTCVKDVILGLEHSENYEYRHITFLISELERVISEVLLGLKTEFPVIFN